MKRDKLGYRVSTYQSNGYDHCEVDVFPLRSIDLMDHFAGASDQVKAAKTMAYVKEKTGDTIYYNDTLDGSVRFEWQSNGDCVWYAPTLELTRLAEILLKIAVRINKKLEFSVNITPQRVIEVIQSMKAIPLEYDHEVWGYLKTEHDLVKEGVENEETE